MIDCDHERLSEPRARTILNGSTQYRLQCLDCGRPVGNPVKKPESAEPFDEELLVAVREHESAERRSEYAEYLASDEWRDKRAKVLRRANYRCEGCGVARATQVHHTTYAHVRRELLFELVALCDDCHETVHGVLM